MIPVTQAAHCFWATSSHYVGQSLAYTVHSNTTDKFYMFIIYFPLRVSLLHIDHHQVECRLRRKSADVWSLGVVSVLSVFARDCTVLLEDSE